MLQIAAVEGGETAEELQRRGELEFVELKNIKSLIEYALDGDLRQVQQRLETDLVTNFKQWCALDSHEIEDFHPKQGDLINAIHNGKFDLRKTWIGQKWSRQMKKSKFIPGLGNYDDCKSPEERTQFRHDWCLMLYNESKQAKKESRTWQRTDRKK